MNSSTLSKEFLANIHVNADGLENVMRLLLCAPAPEAKIPETETLLIWGKEDIITPTAIGQTLEKILPNATLFQIADSRHLPHIEAPDGIMWRLKSRLG